MSSHFCPLGKLCWPCFSWLQAISVVIYYFPSRHHHASLGYPHCLHCLLQNYKTLPKGSEKADTMPKTFCISPHQILLCSNLGSRPHKTPYWFTALQKSIDQDYRLVLVYPRYYRYICVFCGISEMGMSLRLWNMSAPHSYAITYILGLTNTQYLHWIRGPNGHNLRI